MLLAELGLGLGIPFGSRRGVLRLIAKRAVDRIRALGRAVTLAALYPLALADAVWLHVVTTPTGTAFAHARAAWLHRWCRIVCRVLGLRVEQSGFSPVSGMVIADDSSLLAAVLLAATHPCAFVVGEHVKRWPVVGLLARLGGTLFVDTGRRHDLARINFMIQRVLRRRLLVVIFPGCNGAAGTASRSFTSALLQPAVELGCTLTVASIGFDRMETAGVISLQGARWDHLRHSLAHTETHATISFSPPTFRRGDRKQLAQQLRREALEIKRRAAWPESEAT
jgi:hypothetical protein